MSAVTAVLDVGKTHAKLSLVAEDGRIVAARSRANNVRRVGSIRVLDTDGIERWLVALLLELGKQWEITAIVPVAHGATAAFIAADGLAAPVMDYETAPPDEVMSAYRALRDPFDRTLSPPLPLGLNLGLQLFWQEKLTPDLWPGRARVLPWPQYWAYWLSGVAANEVSSLGCHSDLWYPRENRFSDLARSRGWDRRFAALSCASETVGQLRTELANATRLPPSCEILCGLHDSNASLFAARRMMGAGVRTFSLVSTGTWFVALQFGATRSVALDPARDTLGNVDVDGHVTPSSRFMGGREYETILGEALGAAPSLADAARIVAGGILARPSFIADCGPFPSAKGKVTGEPRSPEERAALASLYLALMQDVSLDLIGAEGPLVIEGRFAGDPVFAGALAGLRSGQPVYRCALGDGIALGAASLRNAHVKPPSPEPVAPLPLDLQPYRARWRSLH
jgi:sugar (pentulose or hexulose) kinase